MQEVVLGTWLGASIMLIGPAQLVDVHCEDDRCAAIVRSLADIGRIRADGLYVFPFSRHEKPENRLIPSMVVNLYLSSVKHDTANPFGYSTAGPTDDVPSNIEAILYESKERAAAHLGTMVATTDFEWQEVPQR